MRMSLCMCVCANDGRVNSIAIPRPFRFPLYFPTIRTKFEDDRFQGTRERIRFDFVRVHAFRNAPNSSRFVSHSLLGTSFAVPFHPKTHPRRDIDIDRSVVT